MHALWFGNIIPIGMNLYQRARITIITLIFPLVSFHSSFGMHTLCFGIVDSLWYINIIKPKGMHNYTNKHHVKGNIKDLFHFQVFRVLGVLLPISEFVDKCLEDVFRRCV